MALPFIPVDEEVFRRVIARLPIPDVSHLQFCIAVSLPSQLLNAERLLTMASKQRVVLTLRCMRFKALSAQDEHMGGTHGWPGEHHKLAEEF